MQEEVPPDVKSFYGNDVRRDIDGTLTFYRQPNLGDTQTTWTNRIRSIMGYDEYSKVALTVHLSTLPHHDSTDLTFRRMFRGHPRQRELQMLVQGLQIQARRERMLGSLISSPEWY